MEKIKKNREFQKIYNNSKKMHSQYAIIFVKKNNVQEKRFGFVASKKTGNAVQRNRIKRLFREVIRLNTNHFQNNYDYVFVGKSNLKEKLSVIGYKQIEKDILKMVKK